MGVDYSFQVWFGIPVPGMHHEYEEYFDEHLPLEFVPCGSWNSGDQSAMLIYTGEEVKDLWIRGNAKYDWPAGVYNLSALPDFPDIREYLVACCMEWGIEPTGLPAWYLCVDIS